MFIVSQQSLNGAINRNPFYLHHCNITSVRVNVNGNNRYSLSGSFPNHTADYYVSLLDTLKSRHTLITAENFVAERTVFVFDLTASMSDDCVKLEERGNLDVEIRTSQNVSENMTLFLVGNTNGLINIDQRKLVTTEYTS